MNKKIIFSLIVMFLLIGIVSATYCCEKIENGGPWCQNDDEDKCDDNYQKAPTRCDSTDFCRLGCCYNSNRGTCMQNTAQKICLDNNGTWEPETDCDVPQCEYGCCLLGNQPSFVTQVRCTRLSALYGIGVTFKQNIRTELDCIAEVTSQEEGACVFERDFERTCSRLTQEECMQLRAQNTQVEFYSGRLCSDEDLSTICGASDQTTCVEGKDQVYYLDTCGNIANIYDSTERWDNNYWKYIKDQSESCNPDQNNADSRSCGNCDYFLGSTCKEYDSNEDAASPIDGDYICRDLSCMYDSDGDGVEERYEHGEMWCGIAGGVSEILVEDILDISFGEDEDDYPDTEKENVPGSRYYRLSCYNGDVILEPCADYRQEICIQSDVDGFKSAICRINRWEDCIAQESEDDCTDQDNRDCRWLNSKCIPLFAPGFEFWDAEEDAEEVCALGNDKCVITYEKHFGTWECTDNCNCEKASWATNNNNFCRSLGDCGSSINYVDVEGRYSIGNLTVLSGRLSDQGDVEEELAS